MRNLLISISVTFLLISSSISLAQPDNNKLDTNKLDNNTNQSSQQVMLYEQPDTKSKVLENLTPTTSLIPIIHQKGWVKVGDPKNGQVGWINTEQYRSARDAYFQPNIQTMMVQVNENKEGKPTITVIAYQNGKKLDDKDAQKLYQQIKAQQERHQRHMQRFTNNMNDLFKQNFEEMRHVANDSWIDFPPVDARSNQLFVALPDFDTQDNKDHNNKDNNKNAAENKADADNKNQDKTKVAKDNTENKTPASATTPAKEVKS